MTRVSRLVLLLLALTLLGGCAGAEEEGSTGRGDFGGAQLGENGRLIADPAPLTVEDVDRQPEDSPERAVMEMLFWAQWGSAPNVLTVYDNRVRQAVGLSATGAYNLARVQLVASYPRIVESRRSPEGMFLGIELFSKTQVVRRESFLLKRRGGEWKIVYDTLLDRALGNYVRFRKGGDPTGANPGPRAVIEAEELAQSYRNIFLQERDRGRGSN